MVLILMVGALQDIWAPFCLIEMLSEPGAGTQLENRDVWVRSSQHTQTVDVSRLEAYVCAPNLINSSSFKVIAR